MMSVLLLGVVVAGQGTPNDESLRLVTTDGVSISALLREPAGTSAGRPAVIFVHQGGSSKAEWTSTDLFQRVVGEGWLALAYDIRGHGDSGGQADISTLFDDPAQAPLDLLASIDFLQKHQRVDDARIAVVGASIGSNLACVAVGNDAFAVKTAVAISGKTSAVFNLAGGEDQIPNLSSVYHIASELEQDGQRAEWASEMYGLTRGPRKLEITAGSSGHGVSIFNDDSSLQMRILAWLQETL